MPRIGLTMLLFLLGLAPLAANYVAHHPDERHYTDAAIGMLQSGAYVLPRHPDGAPRCEKPGLTYWFVAGSYAVLGVHPLASRLPFLLAGCGVLWLTYRLALLLTGQQAVARLAALVLLCHPLLIISAPRSMPDVLLCLFGLLSIYGFLGLLAGGAPTRALYLAAYGGAGLAVATKGLPGLLLVGFAWIFAALNPWQRVPLRRLVYGPGMILGLILGAGWFLLVYVLYGPAPLGRFWRDQVTERVTPTLVTVPGQLGLVLGCLAAILLPWSAMLLPVALRRPATLLPAEPSTRQGWCFLLLWAIFLALLISATNKFSVRYLLLVSPVLAVLLADVLYRTAPAMSLAALRVALLGAAGTLCLVAALAVAVEGQLGQSFLNLAGCLLLAGGTLTLLAAGWRGPWPATAAALAVSVFLLVPAKLFALRSLVLPDQGTQIARSLARFGLEHGPVGFLGPPPLASKIRVCAGGGAGLVAATPGCKDQLPLYAAMITRADNVAEMCPDGWTVETVSLGYRNLPPLELAVAIWKGGLPAYLERHRERYELVIRPEGARTLPGATEEAELHFP